MPDLDDLPDLVINKILNFLPTKAVIQTTFLSKQFRPIYSASALNFNEWEDYDHRYPIKKHKFRHKKFIKFLKGYLKYHEKYEKKEVVETLRLRLSMFLYRDGREATVIDRWLNRAINGGLKELDLRLTQNSMNLARMIETEKMYRLPWAAFANNNPQSLARLNLEYVKISDIKSLKLQRDNKYLLPSLKTMSFLCARFDVNALSSLLLECPSITYLSLMNCSFRDFKCCVSSSSLTFLELKHCIELQELHVHNETKNLESFTFVCYEKPYSICENVILNKSFKLKSINIHVECEFHDPYHFSWVTLFSNAKFLTSLKLHGTRLITHINSANVQADDDRLLPSLKSLFFTSSRFADKTALSSLLSQCPSVEHLSINNSHFENLECHVSSSSLKSLEVNDSQPLRVFRVDDQAKNLESLAFVLSPPDSKCEKVIVNNAFNLKKIDIRVDDLDELSFNGYHRTLKAINVHNLHLFDFLGTMNDGFSVEECQLAKIAVREFWYKNWFVHYSSHFPRLIGYLKALIWVLQENIHL